MADQALEKVERSHVSNKQGETVIPVSAAHWDVTCEGHP